MRPTLNALDRSVSNWRLRQLRNSIMETVGI
jgi:hypothetical protein